MKEQITIEKALFLEIVAYFADGLPERREDYADESEEARIYDRLQELGYIKGGR